MRVGLIGVGSMGQNHARILADMGVLAGVSDISPEAAKKVGGKYSVESFTDHESLLKKDLDAVVIVTPTSTHKKVASDAPISNTYMPETPLSSSEVSRILVPSGDHAGLLPCVMKVGSPPEAGIL